MSKIWFLISKRIIRSHNEILRSLRLLDVAFTNRKESLSGHLKSYGVDLSRQQISPQPETIV